MGNPASSRSDARLFQIKICGVKTVADALLAARAGTDAIGLNFYSGSQRCIDVGRATQIAAALPAGVVKVGVFVNASSGEIRSIAEQVGLDAVQLHGDEPPQTLGELRGLPLIKAFRIAGDDAGEVDGYLEQCEALEALPQMILVNTFRAGTYGGTGAVLDWQMVNALRLQWRHVPLVLAGGLTPNNVAQAIRAAQPAAVDTASGVEASPGKKDAVLVRAFIAAARTAFHDS